MLHRFSERYPDLGKGPIPIAPYVTQEVFERERDLVFRKVWLNVGRVEQIPAVGDFFVKDIKICGVSAVVVRQADGSVAAFHNVCSHRCNKLVWEREGKGAKAFRCKFHSWVYATNGKLTSVPDQKSFFDLKMDELGLTPIALDTWSGFIFINLDPHPSQSLKEFLGGLGDQLAPFPFGEMTTNYFYETEFKTNWKVALDAFQEGYHVSALHNKTVPGFGGSENPYCRPLDVILYGPHGLISQQASPNFVVSPTAAIIGKYAQTYAAQMHGSAAAQPGMNPTKAANWVMDACVFFPNFMCAVTSGGYFTYNFWPLAIDRVECEIRIYYPATTTVGQLVTGEFNKVMFRDVFLEDVSTLEQTQEVLASGAKTHFHFQDNEILLRHAYKTLEGYVGADAA